MHYDSTGSKPKEMKYAQIMGTQISQPIEPKESQRSNVQTAHLSQNANISTIAGDDPLLSIMGRQN